MGRAKPVEHTHPVEQIVGDAMHDLTDVAEDVSLPATEVGYSCCRPHSAQEPVALDKEHGGMVGAADAAAAIPAGPPPNTTTSNSPKSGNSRAGSSTWESLPRWFIALPDLIPQWRHAFL